MFVKKVAVLEKKFVIKKMVFYKNVCHKKVGAL